MSRRRGDNDRRGGRCDPGSTGAIPGSSRAGFDERPTSRAGAARLAKFEELSRELYHRKPALIKRAVALGARDADDAEGMIQETLFLMWKATSEGQCAFDDTEPFMAYFHKTLSSVAVDRHRKRTRIDCADDATLEQQPVPLGFEGEVDPEQLLVAREERSDRRQNSRALRAGIQRLPNTQRWVVERRSLSDEGRVMTYPEIAEALGKSVPAVRSACRRGVAKLRDSIR